MEGRQVIPWMRPLSRRSKDIARETRRQTPLRRLENCSRSLVLVPLFPRGVVVCVCGQLVVVGLVRWGGKRRRSREGDRQASYVPKAKEREDEK